MSSEVVTELAFVALGSNLGDRSAHLAGARAALTLIAASRMVAVSTIEETAPLGGMAQGPFLNQMVAMRTTLEPAALLASLHRIEASLGRVRAVRWGPRTIDLDIVEFGDRHVNTATLDLPHPGLAQRDFWRRELAELTTVLERSTR